MQSSAKKEDWQLFNGPLESVRKPLKGQSSELSPLHPVNIAKGRLASARMNLKQAKYELLLSEERVYLLEQALRSTPEGTPPLGAKEKPSLLSGFKWSLPLLGKKAVLPAASFKNDPIQKDSQSPKTIEGPCCFQLSWKTVNSTDEVQIASTVL